MSVDQTAVSALLARAKELTDQRRDDEALSLYLQACQQNPKLVAAWIELAAIYLRQQRYPDCLNALARVQTSGESPQLRPYLIAAAALKGMNRYADADRTIDAALTLAPEDPRALNLKAGILLAQQRFTEILPLVEHVFHIEPANLEAQLHLGIALHGLGRSAEALAAFDRLLTIEPNHASALMNRSSVLVGLARYEEALQAADAALQIQPNSIIALLNQAAALLGLRQPQAALAATERLLQINSRHNKGLINKTIALLALNDFAGALATIAKALTFDSFNPDLLELQIQALLGLKRFPEALTNCQKALAKQPNRLALKLSLAKALIGSDKSAEAEQIIEAVLAVVPNHPEALSLKAQLLVERGDWETAHTLIDQALIEHPHEAQLWVAQSALLLAKERYVEALTAAEQALALQPNHLQATINQMAAMNNLQRFDDARVAGQALIAHKTPDWQLYANQGAALAGLEHFAEARQAFATAEALDQKAFRTFRWRQEIYGIAPDALLPAIDPCAEFLAFKVAQLERCDWQGYETILSRATALIEGNLGQGQLTPLPPFKALSLPFPPQLTMAIAQSRGTFLDDGMAAIRQALAFNYPNAVTGPLKIGYVSADFREHPTAHLIRSLFALHDRRRFEIFVYALCADDGSTYYQQIKADADHFVDLTRLSNAEAATRINADGIHILIDLMGYTSYARTEIFALRPAPVQASYLGYPGTLGAPFIPYILADEAVLPEPLRPYFTEQPVYLPECYQVNDFSQEISTTGIQRRDVGLPETGFVFCCFNKPAKIDPVMFKIWMRILQRVPDSVLWLLATTPEISTHLRHEAEACQIDGERLIFAERLPKPQHLERHPLADLFLDTRLYNAHTTASDALWAGLPVLTCPSETFPARVAASLLKAIDLPELIVDSLDEYEQRAVHLATTPAELGVLRAKLLHNRTTKPLFNTHRFVCHLEQAYTLMWNRHAQGLAPALLRVEPSPTD